MIDKIKKVFPYTIPILIPFLFLGMGYGIYMRSLGYNNIWTAAMSGLVFSGSLQFVLADALAGTFNALSLFVLILMLNVRHFFYGISLLPRFKDLKGIKKEISIFALCDETYSIFIGIDVPDGIDKIDFYFIAAVLNYTYWVISSVAGCIFGGIIDINLNGIDFMLTGLFFVVFLSQWKGTDNHFPAILGVVSSIVGYIIFKDMFILPSMLFIIFVLYFYWRKYEES